MKAIFFRSSFVADQIFKGDVAVGIAEEYFRDISSFRKHPQPTIFSRN